MLLTNENEKSPRRGAPSQQSSVGPSTEAPRILIIEDVLFVAWDLESMLQDLGFDVCGLAPTGEAAIELAARLTPNFLLVDINLGPGIDGIEAARRICTTRDAAVVFVTAYGDAANRERIRRAFPGAPVVVKPATPDSLQMAITAARKTGRG
jgi:CheY-like chemotaxis protein